jgi:type II secretory pathway component PulF
MSRLSQAIESGETLTDGLKRCGDYFPPFFNSMVNVGEKTGTLDRVLIKLAEHYEHLISLRRVFLLGIAWPVIQLVIAIVVIGLLIIALGWVAGMTGERVDILGFGLVGGKGLVKYTILLNLMAAIGYGLFLLFTRGPLAQTIRELVMRVPGLGPSLRVMSLSRMAWSLGMAIDAGASARMSMKLALQSTMNAYYTRHSDELDAAIRTGSEMHTALRATQAFPQDFLDAVEVGEQSGRLTESLEKLAENYQAQAKVAAATLTLLATMLVWGGVGAVLIFLIFRLASFYLGVLYDATQI